MLKFVVGLLIGVAAGMYLGTYGRELADTLGLSALVTLL